MAAALQAAIDELGGTATENVSREMAQRILSSAAEGVFELDKLKQAALGDGLDSGNLAP
jgi:hypothetical protein